jgi:hypothetical protein
MECFSGYCSLPNRPLTTQAAGSTVNLCVGACSAGSVICDVIDLLRDGFRKCLLQESSIQRPVVALAVAKVCYITGSDASKKLNKNLILKDAMFEPANIRLEQILSTGSV